MCVCVRRRVCNTTVCKGAGSVSARVHTHTHTERERERERDIYTIQKSEHKSQYNNNAL